jgi:A/G-specific adenine glycosylase
MAQVARPAELPGGSVVDAAWRRSLRRAVFVWYERHARDLPWRRSLDPYRVWVSEIMLQQTQVETVRAYFERFVARFPTAAALAGADETEVLRLWEGLGYYRRARLLQQAAKRIVELHQGEFPRTVEQVRELPGIGRYTAGAILSIAFDQRQPILEGNTIRLYSRLLGYFGDPRGSAGQKKLWDFAEAILPRRRVGRFNQAMMEIGSTVCKPRRPGCEICPLARHCPTQAFGWQLDIPAESKKTRYEDIAETAVIVRRQKRVLLRRCGPRERWEGLWDFPRFARESAAGDLYDVADQVESQTGVRVSVVSQLTELKHAVTRFRITLTCFQADYQAGQPRDRVNCRWVTADELAQYPLSVTGRELSRWVNKHASNEVQ